jgi:hypothetical protein
MTGAKGDQSHRPERKEVHWLSTVCIRVRITRTLTGRGERMRASGPVERVVRRLDTMRFPAGTGKSRRRRTDKLHVAHSMT